MPFRSKAQRAYLWANKPELAREFAAKTPEDARLPEHVQRDKTHKRTNRVRVIRPRNPRGPVG